MIRRIREQFGSSDRRSIEREENVQQRSFMNPTNATFPTDKPYNDEMGYDGSDDSMVGVSSEQSLPSAAGANESSGSQTGRNDNKRHSKSRAAQQSQLGGASPQDEEIYISQLKHTIRDLKKDRSALSSDNSDLQTEIQNLKHVNSKLQQDVFEIDERHRKSHERNLRGYQGSVEALKSRELDYQNQLEKMTRIVSQLSKRGLPLPKDDGYFKRELDGLADTIRQFARSFTRGQKPLTREALSIIEMSADVHEYLNNAFLNLDNLLSSEDFGTKIRTRCVEVIMFGELMGSSLCGNPIGFSQVDYLQTIIKNMRCSDEDAHLWKALTVHLLTTNNPAFLVEQEREIDALTDRVFENIRQWGEFKKRVNKEGLKEIVSKVAQLGLELAKLPFSIIQVQLHPGEPFDSTRMEDAEPDGDDDKVSPENTTIILSHPWLKVTFDEEGNEVMDHKNLFCKAKVSCL